MNTSGTQRLVGFVLQFDEEFVSLKYFPSDDLKKSKVLNRRLSDIPGIGEMTLKLDLPVFLTFDANYRNIIAIEDAKHITTDRYFPKTETRNFFNYPVFKPQIT